MQNIQVFILPGGAGRNDAHWYKWLRAELVKRGIPTVVCAQNRVSPLKRAQQLMGRISLRPNTFLVGHSFGGLTALKWVELAKQPVGGMVLVDVSVKQAFESIPQQLLDQMKTVQKKQNLRRIQQRYLESWNWRVDLSVVRRLVPRAVILSENRTAKIFPDWRAEHQNMAKALKAKLVTGNGVKQHFTASREPKILAAIQQLLST